MWIQLLLTSSLILGASPYDQAALQKELDGIHDKGVVSVQALVDTGTGRLSAQSGVAVVDTKSPVPENASFRMGSNTKTFVSSALLLAIAEGKLGLDDPVEKWLPGFFGEHGIDGNAITVRMLLQHTSGLDDYLQDLPVFGGRKEDFEANKLTTYSLDQLLDLGLSHPVLFEPGTSWAYSNTNYIAAGMILENADGRSWAESVKVRVLDPLGLTRTYAPGGQTGLEGPHARAYQDFPPDFGVPVDATTLNPSMAGPAGEMVSTPEDLMTFWQSLLGGKVLQPAQLAEMMTTIPVPAEMGAPEGTEYGLGIFKMTSSCDEEVWGHGGSIFGTYNTNGFTTDGGRGIVIWMSQVGDVGALGAKTVDNAICQTK
jgi:D-alanyl-D-alanine carboxypeptidase